MTDFREPLGLAVELEAVRMTADGGTAATHEKVSAEIPLTITAGGAELATLLASPAGLRELTYGYLFTSGFIASVEEVKSFYCDETRWQAEVSLSHSPDTELLRKRLYTAGCGKCAMYTSVVEIMMRKPLESSLIVSRRRIFEWAARIKDGTPLFAQTGSVHTAILFEPETGREIVMDDVARHNAVDKAIGMALLTGLDMRRSVLARTGRTSSEIIYKARKAGIPVTIARGAPTHQAVLLARELGITLAGFAREESCTVYSFPERIVP